MLKIILRSLFCQVLIAIFLAILFGHFCPNLAIEAKPLGDGFIKLVKMMIAPLVFCIIVSGIIVTEDTKTFGKLGFKILLYFETITTFALIIGFAVAKLIKPGVGMNINLASLDDSVLQNYVNHSATNNVSDFLLNIIPNTIFGAFTQGEILPILFIALLFGFALAALKEQARGIVSTIEQLTQIIFKIINLIMKLAPLGAFGAMSFTIGKHGIASIFPLINLIATFYITCALFIFIVFGFITKLCGFSLWKFLKYIKEEIVLTLGASSLEPAMPLLIKKLEKLGCPKSIAGLVVSSGYSLNLDGTCIYFTLAIIFMAQALNIDLSFGQELYIILVLLITSKGVSGVVGAGFMALATTLSVIHTIPMAALVLILGIDRFMSEARAVTNIISNGVAAMVIARWDGKLDNKKLRQVVRN